MSEPSLNEIVNIARDPGEGSVAPRAKIDTSDLVHTLNQSAQFKAENDWRKYSSFMNDLKGVYKELGDLQGLDVAQADRPFLQKQAAGIFQEIGNDPKKFFGGGMAEIEKKIGQLRNQSAQSMQDKIFDDAHRAYVERDPSLQTDDNKSIIDNYFKQPLGQRKPYMLKLPSLYNPQAIGEQINAFIPQKFSNTGLSPDGKFINTISGTRYDEKQYKTLADQLYNTPDGKTGRIISQEAGERLKALPQSVQDYYKNKYPNDPVKGFYDETVLPWRKQDQIDKTEAKDNPFALEQSKAKDKLTELNAKFGYDKILEEMKLGGQKELAIFKADLKNKSKGQQVGALRGMIDTQIQDAIANTPTIYDYDSKQPLHEIKVSPSTLKIFSYTTGTGSEKQTIVPDNMMVSQDGKNIRVTFYKRDSDGNIIKVNGANGIDESKTKNFSREEYMARFGKDILGVSATEKEINADDEGDNSGSFGNPVVQPSATKQSIPGF